MTVPDRSRGQAPAGIATRTPLLDTGFRRYDDEVKVD
jgi:hypothetical protein